MKRRYFFEETKGLKADIKRHRETEQELRDKISESEANDQEAFARSYRNLLDILLCSKAQVVGKIGKK